MIAIHPWEIIGEELKARRWSQKKFAELSWLTVKQVRNLIKWKLDITSDLAKSIANTFWTSIQLWLNLQNRYNNFS